MWQNRDNLGGLDRYNSNNPILLAGDRAVANFNEWAPTFLILYWTHYQIVGDPSYWGWIYVASRALYPLLAANGGIRRNGARPL